jgi:acid phosphatase
LGAVREEYERFESQPGQAPRFRAASRIFQARSAFMRKYGLIAAAVLAGALLFGYGGVRLGTGVQSLLIDKGCLPVTKDLLPIDLPVPPEGPVRFAALGDTGTGRAGQRRVAEGVRAVCSAEGCDFLVLLGDNFYPDGLRSLDDPLIEQAYESVYGPLERPVLAVLGNHDVHSPALPEVLHTLRSPTWRMPNFEYRFQAGPARFFAVNTNCATLTWWRLVDKVRRPFAGWTFVLGHHSVYSNGPHGDSDWLARWYWRNRLGEPVDFYLAGHNHLLEHFTAEGQRTHYVVSGGGAGEPYGKPRKKQYSEGVPRFRHEGAGFVWFNLSRAQAEVRYYDEAGALLYSFRQDPR